MWRDLQRCPALSAAVLNEAAKAAVSDLGSFFTLISLHSVRPVRRAVALVAERAFPSAVMEPVESWAEVLAKISLLWTC